MLLALLAAPGVTCAQPREADDERERAIVEGLRREDPAAADRYVALRNARAQALEELRRVEKQYNAAGAGLQGVFARSLVQARKKYADAELKLLDFYDARDREIVAKYQEEIGRINGYIESRRKTRAELEKLLAP